jgi:hypothetical protein
MACGVLVERTGLLPSRNQGDEGPLYLGALVIPWPLSRPCQLHHPSLDHRIYSQCRTDAPSRGGRQESPPPTIEGQLHGHPVPSVEGADFLGCITAQIGRPAVGHRIPLWLRGW